MVLLLAAALLGGCGSQVRATAPPAARSTACARAARQWPASVSGHARRATSAGTPAVAAWGDPPIVARCGVPALGPTTAECIAVSGVDWVVQPLSDGASFTTFGRDPALQVLVPHAYAPEPLLLPAFAGAAGALPRNGHHCD